MTILRGIAVLAAALTLTSCSQNDDDPGPGKVTVGESKALDDAAEMLDERAPQLQATPETPTQSASPADAEKPPS